MSIRKKLLLSYILSVMMLIGIFLDDIKGINHYYQHDEQNK
ncbi:hypothetical protein [Bacillus smithii]|nr:hypothetical protein [Bacillus smithii]